MRFPVILAISLAAVLAGSLFLIGPFSINNFIPKQNNQAQQAEAQALPLVIRDRFEGQQLAGDAAEGSRFLKVNEEFIDPENHCEFCTRVEYIPGPQGEAGFSYEDVTGLGLSNAKKVRFWVMGEEGNEKIKFKLAGKSLDKLEEKLQDRLSKLSSKLNSVFKTEHFALTTQEVTLNDDWKKYEVDLTGVDLREITHPFAFELAENGDEKQIVYIKGVVYDDEPAEDPLAATADDLELIEPLAAEIISNGTEGVAPATFDFEANVTGGTEPYSITWNFGDGEESDEVKLPHTFDEAGTYNVTLEVADADDQAASASLEIQVEEPEEEVEESEEEQESTPEEEGVLPDLLPDQSDSEGNSTATNSTDQ